jgi:hypothetical protein
VDLAGSTVIPGFDDSHMHVLSFGLTLSQVDLSPAAAPDIAAIRTAIEEASHSAHGSDWVLGRGYNQNMLAEQRHPTRFDLDPVSGGHPVALWHTSGHIMSCNSRALELAGISGDTPDPTGGEIERGDHGKPTGVLRETAMDLLAVAIPQPSLELAVQAILRASRELAREGITSATDAATGHGDSPDFEIGAYRAALGYGQLLTRLTLMPQIRYVVPNEGGRARSVRELDAGDQPEWLRIGPTKIFSDGALTTRTAAVSTRYLNSGGNGILTWPLEDLERLIRSAHGAGWQIATHAIGDRAIRLVLDAYRAAAGETPRSDARHRIEHCTLIDRNDVQAFPELGIVPVLQPEDIACLGDAYPAAVGLERARNNSPVSWFQKAGAHIAFSSDRPVTPGHPLMGVKAAMERRTASGADLGVEHRVSAEQAIRYYTHGSAFASFAEKDRGVLAPGFLADFVVLDRDITQVAPEEVASTRIVMTVVGGYTAYEA